MKIYLKIALVAVLHLCANLSQAQSDSLKAHIEHLLASKHAEVGVAIYGIERNEWIVMNDDAAYPMQSVFKFHLALAVLAKVDKGELALNQLLHIDKKDLMPDTWSPIRETYPDGADLPLSEIIRFTVSQSDNVGCDFLFKLLGGPKKVNRYIHKLGIKEVQIVANEAQMHKDESVQFKNWTRPSAAVELLLTFYKKDILSKSSYDFMLQTLLETSTGPMRLKGLLPEGTPVAHKTGSSGTNDEGVTEATNDIGIVTLPNGQHYIIAVLVSASTEDETTNERIIAEINKMAWDYFGK